MKKTLKIISLIILVLLVLLIASPFVFKKKIITIANEQLEKNLNAHASFKDLNISLIRKFPNLSVRVWGLCVSGIDEFEGDTLLHVNKLEISVNLISAIKMEDIEIKRIIIDQPDIDAIMLENGKANWDITKETEKEVETDTTPSEIKMKISLKLLQINNANINYTDYSSGMKASLGNFNFTLKGDLSKDFSLLVIDSKTDQVNFIMDGIRYVKDAMLQLHLDVDANLKESIFVLKENSIALNELTLTWDGSISVADSTRTDIKMSFATNNADFKTLLSLVPAIYMRDFKDLKTTGSLKLEGKIDGSLTETTTPSVDAGLLVKNATFAYPALPKSAKNIQIDVKVHYDGVKTDNTTLDVNTFHVELGSYPIDLNMKLRTPISDPFTQGHFQAAIDLATLSDLIPLENTVLKGLINANLDWMGNLSTIEQARYTEFKADGAVNITDLQYSSPDLPKAFSLSQATISFSPQYVNLSSFSATLGSSDFKLQGKISNYIPYILKDEVIKGELTLQSNQIDLNEFMSDESAEEETTTATDTAPMEVIEVPGNIDFRFISSITKLIYDKLTVENISGVFMIKDKRLIMDNLKMNMLKGSLALSGEYNTIDRKNPLVDFKFDARMIDIPMAVTTFSSLTQIVPIAKKATGQVSIGMAFKSLLTQEMKPVMNSIMGGGNLSSNQLSLKGSSAFNKIGEALKTKSFDNMALKNISIAFEILEGNLSVKPFETKLGDASMLIGGKQSLDNSLDYDMDLILPRKMLGLENAAVNNLYSSAASKGFNIPKSETVSIKAKVTGKMSDPKVTLNLKESVTDAKEVVKTELKEAAKEIIDTKTEDVKAQAREEADKILKEAEKQAAQIRAEGKRLADAARSEANKNAQKLEAEATNPLTKAAAKKSGDKLKQEGETKARQIEKEADNKANKVLNEARQRSDAILK